MMTQTGLAEEPHIQVIRFVGGQIMSLHNVWNRLRCRRASSRRQRTIWKPARQGRAFVPRLEGLEARTVPSTLTVTNPADSGDGSLRAVIATAQSGDQIVFDTSLKGQTIALTSGPLAITQSIDIEGPGAGQLAISGNHASRVFAVSGVVTVTIAGLTISDGMVGGSDAGGGILNMGSTLTLANDVLMNNQSVSDPGVTAQGGAVDNVAGATLIVSNSLFSQNQAKGGSGGGANGGAIVNSASRLTVSQSTFSGNQALGGDGGGNGLGGAIVINQSGTATVSDSTFTANLAMGGDGGVVSGTITSIGTPQGGAIFNNAVLTVISSAFTGNQSVAGNGGNGGSANATVLVDLGLGGGIQNGAGGSLVLSGSTFTDDQAVGGSDATAGSNDLAYVGGSAGGGFRSVGTATISDTTFEHNQSRAGNGNMGGSGASVGNAIGGAISNSSFAGLPNALIARKVTIRDNVAIGGTGNTTRPLNPGILPPGSGDGGGIINIFSLATATLSDSSISDNQAIGAEGTAGGNGGDAYGGGINNFGGASLTLSGCMLADNQAVGGARGTGGNGGNGFGGGIYNPGTSSAAGTAGLSRLTVLGSSLTDNEARGGGAGAAGTSAGLGDGGGIWSAGILEVMGSQLVHNQAQGGDGTSGANAGNGAGGGVYVAGGTAAVTDSTLSHNGALGGQGAGGGNGGNGFGGGVYIDTASTLIVSASDITHNLAGGGSGADSGGQDGQGVGGGVYNLGTFLYDVATVITSNHASTSNDDGFGY
jgi:hypothetical protein